MARDKPEKNEKGESLGEEQTTENNSIESLKQNSDFQEYLKICSITEGLTKQKLDSMNETDLARLVEKFESWMGAGKPRPEMPKAVEKNIQVIEKLYRIKSLGKEYLAYNIKGTGNRVGEELIPIYGKTTDDDGNEIEDKSIIIGHDKKYTIPYKESEAKKLVEKLHRDTDNPKLFFFEGTAKISIRDKQNFIGNFDELMEKAKLHRAII